MFLKKQVRINYFELDCLYKILHYVNENHKELSNSNIDWQKVTEDHIYIESLTLWTNIRIGLLILMSIYIEENYRKSIIIFVNHKSPTDDYSICCIHLLYFLIAQSTNCVNVFSIIFNVYLFIFCCFPYSRCRRRTGRSLFNNQIQFSDSEAYSLGGGQEWYSSPPPPS